MRMKQVCDEPAKDPGEGDGDVMAEHVNGAGD